MNRDDFERLFRNDAAAVKDWAYAHPAIFWSIVSFVAGVIVGGIVF